ncbi:glycosyltransferase [Mesorhizobium sp.]|uniref:glycosyltransferase family 32 protein n=1 Tax=Mesorhizobium sp. TaxID=1871066 RepID=UPI000FE715F7|nr:glycosyltransferase [Mesorhizobium sp.]RWH29636.1 MAG: hypothetical protein EOQ76_14155 [Mesorhizobium sp.]RWH37231.1 MAG: hypothetical protein EOQ79_15225 [Mesorhizobium sp.]TIR60150.1 MAG: hypothetical protein E5X22_11025 [Mesorhizobium sp.]TIR69158.1 MAG: hypothetical protein E5X24_14015 [Mesorhizobium sp.]
MPLFSILITDGGSEHLSGLVAENIHSLTAAHPGDEHRLFREAELAEFISTHFGAEVLSAFRTLRPYSYKADLAKYCLLYEQGGLYADLSYFFLRGVPRADGKLSIFRDFLSSTPWDTSIGVVAAPPRHKALAKAIELVCAIVKREYYGPTALCPTGPTLFGKAVALTCEPEDLIVGEALRSVPSAAPLQPSADFGHCLSHDGEPVAFKRKRGGKPISHLGIGGGNRYNRLWRSREVYRDRPLWARIFRWRI